MIMNTEHLTEQHQKLILAAGEIVSDFDTYGEVLQTDENQEYGETTAIERLRESLQD